MEHLYSIFGRSTGICTDTRNIRPGSLFFALKGERFDANAFVAEALSGGAMHVVCSNPDFASDPRCTIVPDTTAALQQLAAYHRDRLSIPVVGITGTNGKTTTKELVAAVLSKKFRTFATAGNLNNQIGVPLSVLSVDSSYDIAVIEMGASHPGDIAELVAIAKPSHGLITNVGKAHIQGFGSFEGVMQTKAELYDYVRRTSGTIFLNADNDNLVRMLGDYPQRVCYGTSDARHCLVSGRIGCQSDFMQMLWKTEADADYCIVTTQITGSYNLENALAAATVGTFFGADADDICQALSEYRPTNSRSQIVETSRNTLLLDAYNANPSSMNASLDNFASLARSGKMAILGAMRELGAISSEEHRQILEKLRHSGICDAWLVGPEFAEHAAQFPEFHFFDTTEDLVKQLSDNDFRHRFVLIKGSRSNRLEQLVPLF